MNTVKNNNDIIQSNELLLEDDSSKNILTTEKESMVVTKLLSRIPNYVENINDIRKSENWDQASEYKENEEW